MVAGVALVSTASVLDAGLLRARRAIEQLTRLIPVRDGAELRELKISRTGVGPIKNKFGRFWQLNFRVDDRWQSYRVLAAGEPDERFDLHVDSRRAMPLRIDSGCTTGQLHLDETCDCLKQLHVGIRRIRRAGQGLVIGVPGQDGRGMGSDFKLGTLLLEDELDLDTYDAATLLAASHRVDARTYAGAVGILKFLGVPRDQRILLLTNNPHKLQALADNGFTNVVRSPIRIPATPHTAKHLAAKKSKMGHLL